MVKDNHKKIYKFSTRKAPVRTNYERYQALINESDEVFEILSSDGTIEYISASCVKVTGYKPKERLGRKIFEFYSGEPLKKISMMLALVLGKPNNKVQDVIPFLTKTGERMHLEVNMKNMLHISSINGIVVNFRNITERVATEEKIQYMLTHDELTGLPNQYGLKQKLEQLNTNAIVIMIDVDRFKYLNNVLGYTIGDQLIFKIAERLKDHIEDHMFLCRYSIDRFIIAIDKKEIKRDIEHYAQSIFELFHEAFLVGSFELYVTACLGISECKDCIYNPDAMIKNAEAALHWAKQEGVGTFKIFSKEIAVHDYRQFELRNDLRKASDKDQLRVHYQPLVCLQTNKVYAIEALMRWDHPVLGMIYPKEFISLAEETGLIINMGKWLLRQVCMDYKKWLAQGYPKILISVNYSGVQFYENNFVQNIKETMHEFGLDPDFLIVEITESVLINKNEKTLQNLKALKQLGIQLALDDFGTGYSSFDYLHVLKTDILKLDKSFTDKMSKDKTGNIIIKTIVNMAMELGIKLVAEGIEDWDQLKSLIEMKCYVGQGFLYSKPVPFDDIMTLLADGVCEPENDHYSISMPRERRKSFRINFEKLVVSDLFIHKIDEGNKVEIGSMKVIIRNIGPGGLCFASNITFECNDDTLFQFKMEISGQEVIVCGHPLWTAEISRNLYECGVYFTMDETNSCNLIDILNELFANKKT